MGDHGEPRGEWEGRKDAGDMPCGKEPPSPKNWPPGPCRDGNDVICFPCGRGKSSTDLRRFMDPECVYFDDDGESLLSDRELFSSSSSRSSISASISLWFSTTTTVGLGGITTSLCDLSPSLPSLATSFGIRMTG